MEVIKIEIGDDGQHYCEYCGHRLRLLWGNEICNNSECPEDKHRQQNLSDDEGYPRDKSTYTHADILFSRTTGKKL